MIRRSVILICICLFNLFGYGQRIPLGTSIDSVYINGTYRGPLYYPKREIYYYKPAKYDSLTSPILWYLHGSGGTGAASSALQATADRRNALIVAPTALLSGSGYPWSSPLDIGIDTVITCDSNFLPGVHNDYRCWLTNTFKQIYRHVLAREKRDSIPVYFTGFSAGAQCVTRYMLIRQAYPDSIPIKMSVSVDPFGYTFCTDVYKGFYMSMGAGLARDSSSELDFDCKIEQYDTLNMNFLCNEHIVQYYNENYGILIGSADFGGGISDGATPQAMAEGANRYERAGNFYNFSDTNAVTRGTTLKWKYAEVPGISHFNFPLYNTPAAGDSIPVAERLLFETPWHPVPKTAMAIDFDLDKRVVSLPNATVQFYNRTLNGTSYLWDFGDGTTSTAANPKHTYTKVDTFTVQLTASDGNCQYTLKKKYFVMVNNLTGIAPINSDGKMLIYPNPASYIITIELMQNNISGLLKIVDIIGNCVSEKPVNESKFTIDISKYASGVYIIEFTDSITQNVERKKIIVH